VYLIANPVFSWFDSPTVRALWITYSIFLGISASVAFYLILEITRWMMSLFPKNFLDWFFNGATYGPDPTPLNRRRT
jgi:hypothetical protein